VLLVSGLFNVKQPDDGGFNFVSIWVMASTSLHFIVNILSTFASTLRCMVKKSAWCSPAAMALAFVWLTNGYICCKTSFWIYTDTIRSLPMHCRDMDVFSMTTTTTTTTTIIWDGKLAWSVIRLDVTVILRTAMAMVTTFRTTSKLCLTHAFDDANSFAMLKMTV